MGIQKLCVCERAFFPCLRRNSQIQTSEQYDAAASGCVCKNSILVCLTQKKEKKKWGSCQRGHTILSVSTSLNVRMQFFRIEPTKVLLKKHARLAGLTGYYAAKTLSVRCGVKVRGNPERENDNCSIKLATWCKMLNKQPPFVGFVTWGRKRRLLVWNVKYGGFYIKANWSGDAKLGRKLKSIRKR